MKDTSTGTERIYHIYAKGACLMHSVKEEEFDTAWTTLKNLVGLMHTDYSIEDLSYEELTINKSVILESSH
jgi:hypothetical protein